MEATRYLKENKKSNFVENGESYNENHVHWKVVDGKMTEERMNMLGLKETVDGVATANGVRCYGHVLRSDHDSALRVALNLGK